MKTTFLKLIFMIFSTYPISYGILSEKSELPFLIRPYLVKLYYVLCVTLWLIFFHEICPDDSLIRKINLRIGRTGNTKALSMPVKIDKGKMVTIRKVVLSVWPFVLAVIVFLTTKISIRNPGFIERYYSEGIYPIIAKFFSFISSLIPFSLWDVFWVFIILLIISGLALVIFKKMKFGRYILRILQLLALLYSFFYLVWGYNYFRPKIEKRVGWEIPKADTLVFHEVLDSIIKQTNSSFIPLKSSDYLQIDTLVEESYRKNSHELKIGYPNGSRRPKIMIFSSLYSKLGLSGYFGPFFNEIHLNYYLLPIDYPYVLAHEKAHQFGITSEAEANLVAFIICVRSDDKRLKYSGYQSLLLYFLRDASRMKGFRDYMSKIDKRVLEDLRYKQKYYDGLENKGLSDIQSAVDNSYLKMNNIEKGVKNYNQVVSLVITWYCNSTPGL